MKNRYLELKNLIVAILLFTVVLWGCQKGDQTLGINQLPGVKILNTYYSPNDPGILTSFLTDQKIRVDRPVYNLLGSITDPIFGRTDAGFAAQFRLPYHPQYPSDAQIDSIVLRMSYKKIYGDIVSEQTFNVYELTGGLDYNAQYLSSYNLRDSIGAEPIGTHTFVPKFITDSLQRDTVQQVISIRLKNSFGNYLLGIDSAQMADNDVFTTVFKGLYVGAAPVPHKGTLLSVDAAASMIVLFYHDAAHDTLGFAYRVTANSANVSSYNHDYTSARFKPNLDEEVNSDSLIYIQPTGGIKSKIMVPSLSTWKDSTNFVINKASLTFHADTITSDFRRYPMPDRLYLKVITDAGEEVFPADSQLSSSYYDGVYNYTNGTYSFNITQHLQELIIELNKPIPLLHNNGFYLVHSDRNNSARRVVLKGFGSSKPVELNVTYTRYK